MVGANTGCKTDLVRGHVKDAFDDRYIATLGTKVSIKRLLVEDIPGVRPVGMDLLLWAIHSHPGFRRFLAQTYLRGTSGVLAVADMARRATLDDLGDWIREVENVAGEVPVGGIGADSDPAGRREGPEDDGRRLAEAYGGTCLFAPANSSEPVEEAFLLLAERIASRRLRRDSGAMGGPADPA